MNTTCLGTAHLFLDTRGFVHCSQKQAWGQTLCSPHSPQVHLHQESVCTPSTSIPPDTPSTCPCPTLPASGVRRRLQCAGAQHPGGCHRAPLGLALHSTGAQVHSQLQTHHQDTGLGSGRGATAQLQKHPGCADPGQNPLCSSPSVPLGSTGKTAEEGALMQLGMRAGALWSHSDPSTPPWP